MDELPRSKVWRHERLLTEHAFDELRAIDCTFAEFALALESAEVIEEQLLDDASMKELISRWSGTGRFTSSWSSTSRWRSARGVVTDGCAGTSPLNDRAVAPCVRRTGPSANSGPVSRTITP